MASRQPSLPTNAARDAKMIMSLICGSCWSKATVVMLQEIGHATMSRERHDEWRTTYREVSHQLSSAQLPTVFQITIHVDGLML